jgi:hypothetical protein
MYPFVVSARANLRRRLNKFERYAERARTIAGVLTSIPGISVKPDPPHTDMMHVYMQGSPDALLQASIDIARTERVLLFRRLLPSGVPGVAAFELSIGDAANELSDDEIKTYFRRLMASGQ